jgi:hypothetical protein
VAQIAPAVLANERDGTRNTDRAAGAGCKASPARRRGRRRCRRRRRRDPNHARVGAGAMRRGKTPPGRAFDPPGAPGPWRRTRQQSSPTNGTAPEDGPRGPAPVARRVQRAGAAGAGAGAGPRERAPARSEPCAHRRGRDTKGENAPWSRLRPPGGAGTVAQNAPAVLANERDGTRRRTETAGAGCKASPARRRGRRRCRRQAPVRGAGAIRTMPASTRARYEGEKRPLIAPSTPEGRRDRGADRARGLANERDGTRRRTERAGAGCKASPARRGGRCGCTPRERAQARSGPCPRRRGRDTKGENAP